MNPAHSGEVVSTFPVGEIDIVDEAIGAASLAQKGWANTPAPMRGEILYAASILLNARTEEAALLLCREEGKTLSEARDEVIRSVRMLKFYGGESWRMGGLTLPSMTPKTHLYTSREPLGIVAVITPWNFPIAIPVWKIAPALMAGNCVVFKPASYTPGIAVLLAQCLVEAGLPKGVLNLIHGSGKIVGEALATDARIDAITFTGSTEVGKKVNLLGAARMARVQLELGGKNAMLVLPDADPAFAADLCIRSAFGVTGQACTATSRVVVLKENRKSVIEALRIQSSKLTIGDGANIETHMGPVIDKSQLMSNTNFVTQAVKDGASLSIGGNSRELFMEPTILIDVEPNSQIAQQEVFGPVLSVITVDSIDEAIDTVNGTNFGLAAGVVTNDLSVAMEFVTRSKVGVVKINRTTTGTDINAPYGGVKDSSNDSFREQGVTAVDFFTRVKTAYVGY